jgi:hypothetical protein
MVLINCSKKLGMRIIEKPKAFKKSRGEMKFGLGLCLWWDIKDGRK